MAALRDRGAWARHGHVYEPGSHSDLGMPDPEDGNVWVLFRNVPGKGAERLAVMVLIGYGDRDEPVIVGLRVNAPMTLERIRALPLDALRRAAARYTAAHWTATLGIPREDTTDDGSLTEAMPNVKTMWRSIAPDIRDCDDLHGPEFLTRIAAVCLTARRAGLPGVEAVAHATQRSEKQAEKYVRWAKDAGYHTGKTRRTDKQAAPATRKGQS